MGCGLSRGGGGVLALRLSPSLHLRQGPKTQASQKIVEKRRAGPEGAVIILEREQTPSAFIPPNVCKGHGGPAGLAG